MSIKTKAKLDIKTAADYKMTHDPFLNGLIFLDACGKLDDFFEKVYTAWDAFNDDSHRYERGDESQIDESALLAIDEHEAGVNGSKRFFLPVGRDWDGARHAS